MKKFYSSKKAKRRAEYLERKKKRQLVNGKDKKPMTIEEMASVLGVRLS